MKSQTMLFAIAIIALLQINLSTASPTCQDSDTFLWKHTEGKNCEWLKSKSQKRREQICNHRWNTSARQHCRKTCDSCGELISEIKVRAACPRKRRYATKNRPAHCLRFQPGLECGITTWTGCNTGDMACTISSSFTCDKTSRRWTSDPTLKAELCEPTMEDKPYGEKCNPDTCPPFKPLERGDCSWYTVSDTCLYDYQVTGCAKGSTSCTPTIEATCNPLTEEWDFDPIYSLCGTGETCDPKTYFDCPQEEPTPGDSCQIYQSPQDCKYGHQIMGCTKDDLFCGYSSMGFCDPLKATWKTFSTMPPTCDDETIASTITTSTATIEAEATIPSIRGDIKGDTTTTTAELPIGEPCDPSACPPSEPRDGSYCGAWEGIKGKQECFYQYTIEGCSSDTLSCQPGVSYTCQIDTNQWIQEIFFKLQCVADDPLWGTECRPTDDDEDNKEQEEEAPPDSGEEAPKDVVGVCPIYPPLVGTRCTKSGLDEGTECPYQYTAIGCTLETLICVPVTRFFCLSGMWQQEIMGVEQCLEVPENLPAWLPCDPETFDAGSYVDGGEFEDPLKASCPDVEPIVGSKCTKTPIEGCVYHYTVVGCTPETLECLPVSTFKCDVIDKMWAEEVDSRVDCAVPKGYPSGECDPAQPIDSEKPVQDEICPSTPPMQWADCSTTGIIDGGCPYNYHVAGCSPDEASCIAIDNFYCEYNPDKQAWLWQQTSALLAPCVDNYTPPGSCNGAIFVPSDEADEDDKSTPNSICPAKEPIQGEDCSKTGAIDGGCSYNYYAAGCSLEEAHCVAIDTIFCEYSDKDDAWLWQQMSMRRELGMAPCEDNYRPPGTCKGRIFVPEKPTGGDNRKKPESSGICPAIEPMEGEDCFKTGHVDGGCPFDYQIFGCTPDDADCLPMNTFFCVHDEITDEWTWHHRIMSGEVCPNGPLSGSCAGTTLILDDTP